MSFLTQFVRLRSYVVLGVIVACVESSCGPIPPSQEPKTNIVLTYCDFTTSLKGNSTEFIQKNHSNMIDQLMQSDERVLFKAYEINRVETNSFFDFYKKLRIDYQDEYDYEQHLDSLRRERKKLDALVMTLYNRYAQDPDYKGANSCILSVLGRAAHRIKTDFDSDTSRYNFFVIIISDMIEECDNSPVGPLFIRASSIDQVEESLNLFKNKMSNEYNPGIDLSVARPYVIQITRPDQSNLIALRETQFKELWKIAFSAAGFTDEALSKWNFSPDGTTANTWKY